MKLLSLIVAATVMMSAGDCKNKTETKVMKGRLEIKGICSNYTIALVEGSIDTALIASNWTDETTNKQYKDVFALGNPCNFPKNIEQGTEFYFTIDTAKQEDCIVCMAYYPKPVRALNIRVQEK